MLDNENEFVPKRLPGGRVFKNKIIQLLKSKGVDVPSNYHWTIHYKDKNPYNLDLENIMLVSAEDWFRLNSQTQWAARNRTLKDPHFDIIKFIEKENESTMESIYNQMNKIDDTESLNEKYNVRTLKDVKKLQEAEAPKSDRSSIKTRVNELIDMVDWSKWEKFTSTGDDTKPEVRKTKTIDDGIRVDVYLGWDYGHKDDIEEYVKAVNEKFEAFAAIVRKQEPSWSVKLVKSHGSRGVTWTNYWAQVTAKNSITESTKVERPKGFKGSVGGYLAIDRYGTWVSSKPNSGGVKISDANYDWIKETFKLTTLPEEEYKTIWGKGTVYKIEKKDTVNESFSEEHSDAWKSAHDRLTRAAEDARLHMDPDFVEYALEDDGAYVEDVIENEVTYVGDVLKKEFPNLAYWKFLQDERFSSAIQVYSRPKNSRRFSDVTFEGNYELVHDRLYPIDVE